MKSYIFSPKERRAVEAFLAGKLGITDHFLSQIRTRTKQFTRLREDVDLYIQLRKAIAAVSA
jgi:hypothetical protein